TAPQLSRSIIRSVKPERSGKVETIEVKFGESDPSVNLLLSVPGAEYQAYAVEVLQKQTPIWRAQIKSFLEKSSPTALISIILHKAYFKPGEYRLTVHGKTAGKTDWLAEYTLVIK